MSVQPQDRYILRFHEDGMRQRIKARAALNRRTMNAEILFLIDMGFRHEAGLSMAQRQEGALEHGVADLPSCSGQVQKENAPEAATSEALVQ